MCSMAKDELKNFLKERWVKACLIVNIILLLTSLIIIFVNIKALPQRSYILYYTSLEGIKMTGYFWNFYLFWFIGFFFSVLHLLLAFVFWYRIKKLSQFILSSNILLNIFLLLAIAAIVAVNL